MQHRRFASASAIGRPSGTDGSDFSYRMVVDSRYTKVAEGKSPLCTLITIQTSSGSVVYVLLLKGSWERLGWSKAVIQFTGAVYTFLSSSKEEGLDVFAASYIAIGFISLIIGELGRRRSRVSLLKVYMIASSMSILISAVCLTKNNSAISVIQDPSNLGTNKFGNVTLWQVIQDPSNLGTNKFGVFEISHVFIGFLVHIFAISTTISLIGNMSPPKIAS